MDIIASLREQLHRLCADASVDPNWLLSRLADGLRERYGQLAVGFVRWAASQPDTLHLLGFCTLDGDIPIPIADDFRPDRRHPRAPAPGVQSETWIPTAGFGQWGHDAIDKAFSACQSAFLVPWLIDKPADWMVLILSPIEAPVSNRQDRGLSVSANLLATNLLRALDARRLARANAWIERELDEISRLQRLLQPDQQIVLEGVQVAFWSHIYHYAGGDYFDIPRLTHLVAEDARCEKADHWGVVIADVSGHGPSAAVEAAMLDAIMRTYPGPVEAGPEALMGYVNRNLFTRRPRAAFISAFVCNYWPADRTLRYVNGGHPPPLLKPARGPTVPLEVADDIPLRIVPDYRWTRVERTMEPGDTLVMFTDGVTESRSPDGEELGADGLTRIVAAADGDACSLLAKIRDGIDAHLGGGPPQDDQTIIVIRFD